MRYKYFDDASILEVVNLPSIGLASHNFKAQLASNIPTYNQFIPGSYLKSQQYLDTISQWTDESQMKMNIKKSNSMIFNFTYNYQFTTSFSHPEGEINVIDDTKLLGTIIRSDLKWSKNTKSPKSQCRTKTAPQNSRVLSSTRIHGYNIHQLC